MIVIGFIIPSKGSRECNTAKREGEAKSLPFQKATSTDGWIFSHGPFRVLSRCPQET